MLPIDPAKKNSFQRKICDGDLVIVYERHDVMKAVKVCDGSELQNQFGIFKHSDWIGKPFGSRVLSNKGGFVYLLAPTTELWTLVLSHRTQILYIADISFVISYLEIIPDRVVLESGAGSGSLSTSLARAVAPSGHRAASARYAIDSMDDIKRLGIYDRDERDSLPNAECFPKWMHHRLLLQDLRERLRRYDQYEWLETRGVDEESLVQSLPKDLRRDIKRYLCLALVRRRTLILSEKEIQLMR
ncbi:tRNA adenine58-N1-methyltransferase catalytic subunit TRMT61A [Cinnamomum micranthum f. kanehirae]|uniref:tRNA (adenine(58)-N(1))-methyltransferase n=1 Tax=Cinnamomum micranthum f. kanehirae TaxID=337451 RepID=A0A443Q276_9MAGN|nr:tRNA adenine58-N1-methyltransferase catalytic subunit TRMT61A [Cinnamomum micranthum f. kanehirae]